MSVNIFGATSGKLTQDNFYIDQKFKVLSNNLTSKVNKSGDTMDGDLLLKSAELRTFGVSDIEIGQSSSLLFGGVENQIRFNYGNPIKFSSSRGFKFTCPSGEICQMGKQSDANLFMNNNYITALRDPERPQDGATKNYVDNKKTFIGYIPALESNISRLGFSASANAVSSPRFQPFGAFNNLNTDSNNGSWLAPGTTGWLQIKCPERVRIWRVALKARSISGRDITSWNLTSSNDGTVFTNLMTSTTPLLGSATAPTFIEVMANDKHQYYRLNITASTGPVDVGIQVFQLYIG